MLVAIDIDGTITAYPQTLRVLAECFLSQGHGVVLLTGATSPDFAASYESDPPSRQQQVAPLLAGLYLPIVECRGRTHEDVTQLKADWCRDQGVALFIDNDLGYCQAVRRVSPGTCCLLVCP